jgi:hypothetical protein
MDEIERNLRDEIKKLRWEISQKQKRENKMTRDFLWHKGRNLQARMELESLRSIVRSFSLPRRELAELGRELVRTFGDEP